MAKLPLGSYESPWLDVAGSLTELSQRLPEDELDVAVLGAGVFGATTALFLVQQGLRVCLIDAGDPLSNSTTASSTVKVTLGQGTRLATIASRLGEAAAIAHATATQSAIEMVGALAQYAPDADVANADQIVYARDDKTARKLEHVLELVRSAGIVVHSDGEVPGLPWSTHAAIRYSDQLSLHPARYLRGLIRAAADGGAVICLGVRATGIDDGQLIEVATEAGVIRARNVVVATHSPVLLRGLYFARMKAKRHYGVVVQTGAQPPLAMTYDAGEPTRSTRRVRINGEDLLIVVGEAHDTGTGDIDTQPTSRWDSLVSWADNAFGVTTVRRHWAAQDLETPDRAPFVGTMQPGSGRILTATGFSAWGMTDATIAAQLVSQRLADKQADGPGDLWGPMRIGGVAGAATLAKWQAEVSARLGRGLIKGRLGDPAELSPGEAGIFRSGIAQVAAYRDAGGVLHKVSARCTHLGCTVKWNAGETSWDCPCHGSRYDIEGKVLDAPATEPLKKVD